MVNVWCIFDVSPFNMNEALEILVDVETKATRIVVNTSLLAAAYGVNIMLFNTVVDKLVLLLLKIICIVFIRNG